ncbi:MAG: hypothetical protein ACKOWQ_02095 [Aquirufa sp.]
MSYSLIAQVDVAKEPHHITIFKNSKIQILKGDLRKGDTSYFHRHSRPSIVFVFNDSHTNSQDFNQSWRENSRKAGSVIFKSFDVPQIHRTTNLNSQNYQMHDVEILSPPSSINLSPLNDPKFTIELQNKNLFVYRKKIEADSIKFTARVFTVVTFMNGEKIDTRLNNKRRKTYGKNDFLALNPGDSVEISNSMNVEIVLTEFL